MAIEIKVTGDTPEEVLKQINGLVASAGGVELVEVGAAPATQLPTDPPPQGKEPPSVTSTASDDSGERPEVDAEGLPWDERIHADAKDPFKADGTWKRRRNLDDETWDAVRAELIAKRDGTTQQAPKVEQTADTVTKQATSTASESSAPAPAPQPQTEQSAPAPTPQPAAEPSAPAPQPAAEPSAPAPTPQPAADEETLRKQVQGKLPKTMQAVGAGPLQEMFKQYGINKIQEVQSKDLAEWNDRMDRMIADPDNASAIAVGMA